MKEGRSDELKTVNFKGNREEGRGNSEGVGRGFKPRPTQSSQRDGAWDPLVGRGNSRATTFVPNQPTQLLPVARSLFPRPKVGQLSTITPSPHHLITPSPLSSPLPHKAFLLLGRDILLTGIQFVRGRFDDIQRNARYGRRWLGNARQPLDCV